MATVEDRRRPDALDALRTQNEKITNLLDIWDEDTARLREADSVNVRWERGSTVKLLLQHLAVREEAKSVIVARLNDAEEAGIADRLEASGRQRRQAIDHLDEAVRGHQAITLNEPHVDDVVQEVRSMVRDEIRVETETLLAEVERVLAETGTRAGLPSARRVQMDSPTHPSPVPAKRRCLGQARGREATTAKTITGSPTYPTVLSRIFPDRGRANPLSDHDRARSGSQGGPTVRALHPRDAPLPTKTGAARRAASP